jgi:hypothetical protein
MWQTMFNTDNLEEAQRIAHEQGLRIDVGTAGLLGKRKKYTYTWGNQPATDSESPTGSQMSTTTEPAAGPNIDDMGFLERMFYKKGNVTSPKYNITKGDMEPKTYDMPAMKSTFDPTGYNADYSGGRNQIFQNRRRRIGDKLDNLYYKENLVNSDSGLTDTWSKQEERKKQRLENRYNRIGPDYGFETYTAPEEIEQKMYGGLPKARDGQNTVVEKEISWLDKAGDKYSGLDRFNRRQAFKSMATNILNTRQQPDPVAQTTLAFENMNPALGTQKGTMDPQGSGNIFLDKTYAVYDNFAPQYSKYGGDLKSGDVVYWDDDMIEKFIQAGGQVEFLD